MPPYLRLIIGVSLAFVLAATTILFLGKPIGQPRHNSNRKRPPQPPQPITSSFPVVECNPYTALSHGLSKSYVWSPILNNTRAHFTLPCGMKTPSDNLAILKSNQTQLPRHLRNKLVLLIGDSYERNLVRDICELTGRKARAATLNGTLFTNNQGYSGSTYICTITKDSASFVLVSVFHLGVLDPMPNAKKHSNHWQPDSPTDLPDRISWIPHMLKFLAKELYPALCPRLKDGIKIDALACPHSKSVDKNATLTGSITQPPLWKNETSFWYPIPDMIVAQSSAWDLKTMEHSNEALSNWANAVSQFLISPVLDQFGSVVKDSFEFNHDVVQWRPRLFLRTSPMVRPFIKDKTFDSQRLHKMNNLVRSGAFFELGATLKHSAKQQRRFGVLDWDSLITGLNDWYKDGFHPGPESNKAYLQMLLARLEGLEHDSGKLNPL